MPVVGRLDLASALAGAPFLNALPTEGWELRGAEILQVLFEVAEEPAERSIPAALHPSIPPYASLTIARFADSRVGPFALAQVRLVVRAGIRPRGYLVGAAVDSDAAAEELNARWGFGATPGAEIHLLRRNHLVTGEVRRNGETILGLGLRDPEPISGAEITYLDSLHLVRLRENGGDTPLVIQVDPEYRFQTAERGRPEVAAFQPKAWNGADGLRLTSAISATFTRCDTDLPKVRFAFDPSMPAARGRRKIAEA